MFRSVAGLVVISLVLVGLVVPGTADPASAMAVAAAEDDVLAAVGASGSELISGAIAGLSDEAPVAAQVSPEEPDTGPVPEAAPGEEIPGRRTPTTRTFATSQADEFRTEVFADPIHYQNESGAWKKIDPRLIAEGSGVSNAADAVDLHIAESGRKMGLAEVELDDGVGVAFGLRGAAEVAGERNHRSVSFESILPEVDVKLTSVPGGVKEEIVLHSPKSPRVFEFPLTLEGLTASINGRGDVDLVDQAGKDRATFRTAGCRTRRPKMHLERFPPA